jgi:hypothetical protein
MIGEITEAEAKAKMNKWGSIKYLVVSILSGKLVCFEDISN